MKLANLISSICMGIFSLLVIISSLNMEYYDDYGIGYGFLPFWVGIIMLILSLLWLFETIRNEPNNKNKFIKEMNGIKRVFLLGIGILITIILIDLLGYFLALVIFNLYIILYFEKQKNLKSQIISFATLGSIILLIYLIFSKGFGIAFPSCFIEL